MYKREREREKRQSYPPTLKEINMSHFSPIVRPRTTFFTVTEIDNDSNSSIDSFSSDQTYEEINPPYLVPTRHELLKN